MERFYFDIFRINLLESWKYGERAFRYSQLDVGHAIASLKMSARALGWKFVCLHRVGDDQLGQLLGLNRSEDFPSISEAEYPEVLILMYPDKGETDIKLKGCFDGKLLDSITKDAKWFGKANLLSKEHYNWEIIDVVAEATRRPTENKDQVGSVDLTKLNSVSGQKYMDFTPKLKFTAQQIIRQRRSGVDFDGYTSIDHMAFYHILSRLVPSLVPSGNPYSWFVYST